MTSRLSRFFMISVLVLAFVYLAIQPAMASCPPQVVCGG